MADVARQSGRSAESKHGTRVAGSAAQVARAADLRPEAWSNTKFGDDLLSARWDVEYFSERFLGITPHPGQKRLWREIMVRDATGWEPRYLDINAAAGNRAGKTLGIAIPMFHNTFFKIGSRLPNPLDETAVLRWAKEAYEWYHFAIAQETSELAYIEMTRFLAGTHEAQKHGCPLTDEVGMGVADGSKKYRGEYLWMRVHEAFGGGSIHFRTTGEKAIGSLGKDMHGISYDEAGFDPHMEFVVNEVLHLRRLSTGGQLWVIGTSTEGLTAFADRWEEGNPDAPDHKVDSMSIRMSTRENIGFGISEKQFDRLVAAMPPEIVPQNIDGFFLQGRKAFFSAKSVDDSFVLTLDEVAAPIRGHVYVQGVDPALTFDSTWSVVLDTTARPVFGVRAEKQSGRTTGPIIAALATNSHNAYNVPGVSSCTTGIDATGFGGAMFRDLLDIKALRSVEFGGTRGKKLKLLNDLKAMLEKGELRFPRVGKWLELRRQLLGYRLDDKGLQTDAVMALAVAVSILKKNPGGPVSRPFDYFHPGQRRVSYEPSGPRQISASSRVMAEFLRRGG